MPYYKKAYEDWQRKTKKFQNCVGQTKIKTIHWKEKATDWWWIYWQVFYKLTLSQNCRIQLFFNIGLERESHGWTLIIIRGFFKKWQDKQLHYLTCNTNIAKYIVLNIGIIIRFLILIKNTFTLVNLTYR